MADLRRVGCIENGTFVDAGGLLQVQLSGIRPGLAAVEQLFSQGFSNAETCSIVFYTDTTTWAAYSGAVFTTGTPNYLDLLTATEEETGSSGAPTDGASVVVYAIAEIKDPTVLVTADRALTEEDNGTLFLVDSASRVVLTMDSGLSSAWQCVVVRLGSGAVEIAPASGDTINGHTYPVVIDAQYDEIRVLRGA